MALTAVQVKTAKSGDRSEGDLSSNCRAGIPLATR